MYLNYYAVRRSTSRPGVTVTVRVLARSWSEAQQAMARQWLERTDAEVSPHSFELLNVRLPTRENA